MGPQMCCVSTSEVNEMEETVATVITSEIVVGAQSYVDDILGMGDEEHVEKTGKI